MITSTFIKFSLIMIYALICVSCYFADECKIPDHAWCDQNQAYNCFRPGGGSEHPEPFGVDDCRLSENEILPNNSLKRLEKRYMLSKLKYINSVLTESGLLVLTEPHVQLGFDHQTNITARSH